MSSQPAPRRISSAGRPTHSWLSVRAVIKTFQGMGADNKAGKQKRKAESGKRKAETRRLPLRSPRAKAGSQQGEGGKGESGRQMGGRKMGAERWGYDCNQLRATNNQQPATNLVPFNQIAFPLVLLNTGGRENDGDAVGRPVDRFLC